MPQPAERLQVHPQFRHRLHELRQAAGLSLRELGKRANYSHSYIHDLERGNKQPTAATAARLDAALSAGGLLTTLVTVSVSALLPPRPAAAGSRSSPDLGLEFAPDWRQAVDTATGLWRWNVQRRDPLGTVGFTAAAFLAPAMRWLTSPLDERPVGYGERLVGPPDVDTITQITATLRGLDNH
jgi:transcriptional regulator with XRE-family HTH domain